VIRRVASNSALIDPALTAKFCSGYDNTYYIKSLPQRVAIHWAKKDPVATLAWLRTINDLDARDTGVREAYRLWLRQDKATAIDWVKNDENHDRWKDEAVAMYARRLQLNDPELALGVTERIVGEDLRIATQVIIAKTWKVKDPAEAKAWVENESGMTPPEKARTDAITTRQRLRILYVLEMQAGLTEDAAKERLEDWSDPDVKRTPQEKSERLRSPSPTIQKMRH
jgi:phage terminase small subunit